MARSRLIKKRLSQKRRAKRRKTLKRRMWGGSEKLYPISFSFPAEKMVGSIPSKMKLLSDLVPGKLETYIYDTEKDYYDEYRKSLFATTTKKAGWDCLRHYEIIANGAIPYFPGIEECPVNTMALFPKNLLLVGNELYKRLSKKKIDDLTVDERDECNKLIQRFLDYMKAHLTTVKMAKYILDKTGCAGASKILFLSEKVAPDYLRCLTLHGLKELYGAKCHDYPKIAHIYKSSDIDYKALYGKGITYTNLLDQALHDNALDASVEDDIKKRKYDLIIYGSWHTGKPYYDVVSAVYKPDDVIMLCGDDIHTCDYNEELHRGHHVFVREL